MNDHLIGQTCALLAAITWAGAIVLFKRSGERMPPIGLSLFKNTIALLLLAPTLVLLVAFEPTHAYAHLRQFDTGDFCILMLSGIIGIAIADTLFFYALNLIGVGLISIVDCAYSPFVLLCAWLMLSETLAPVHYVGGTLIIVGVFIASRHKPPANRTRGQLLLGMLLAIIALATMAVGVVMAKPIIQEMAVIWSTIIRLAAGMLLLALFALLGQRKRAYWAVFRPSAGWKFAVPASVLGSYLAMIFWIAGFKYTYASIAAVLNQTSVIFAIILATVFLKESFSGRKYAAVVLAVMGVLLVSLEDWVSVAWRTYPVAVLGASVLVVLLAAGAYFGIRALLPSRRPLASGCPVVPEAQPPAGAGSIEEEDILPEELHP